MKLEDSTTIDQLADFLAGTRAVAFSVISDKAACYRRVPGERGRFRYLACCRHNAGSSGAMLIPGYFLLRWTDKNDMLRQLNFMFLQP